MSHQVFHAGRLDKYIAAFYIRLLNAFHALHINVQNADASRATDVGNSLLANMHKT